MVDGDAAQRNATTPAELNLNSFETLLHLRTDSRKVVHVPQTYSPVDVDEEKVFDGDATDSHNESAALLAVRNTPVEAPPLPLPPTVPMFHRFIGGGPLGRNPLDPKPLDLNEVSLFCCPVQSDTQP